VSSPAREPLPAAEAPTASTAGPAPKPKVKITWHSFVIPAGFTALHLGALLAFFVDISWVAIGLFLAFYWLRLFGITAGLHRLFAHRGYKAKRWFQFMVGFLGAAACQGGPLWWAAHHRRHHKYSDTDDDPHSPIAKSIWHAHVGWVLSPGVRESNIDIMKDWFKYPEIRLLNKYELAPAFLQACFCYLVGALTGAGGWSCVVWGFLVSTVFLYHCTFLVNSACHLMGTRRYHTTDESRNNWWVAILTFGEGWHNNHHHYPSSARNGFKWWEFDPTFYILKVFSWFGVVWDMRSPTPRALSKNTIVPQS